MNENEKKEAWKMIMDIAREAGFIRFAFAGVALLNMNEEEKRETSKKASDRQMDEEAEQDLTRLINKEMLEGLTHKEEKRKALLIRVFKSGK